ncbi:MAG: sulfatase [Rhizobiaceae bacterium]|nr:sulfatase [Rhizobiaceae bacterium]
MTNVGATLSRRQTRHGAETLIAAAVALTILHLALALPDRPDALRPSMFLVLPLELLAAVTLLLAFSPRTKSSLVARLAVTAAICISIIVKLADIGMFSALNRPFNFAYDLPLIPASWTVLSGSTGAVRACGYLAAAIGVACASVALVWWATGALTRGLPRRSFLVSLAMLFVATLVTIAGQSGPSISTRTSQTVVAHAKAAAAAQKEITSLSRDAVNDIYANAPAGSLLDRLAGRDIIVAFVESYGRSSIDNPLYAPTTSAALAHIQARLATSGLSARSAWLTSPTYGGQSWLAHSTFMSGLWIDTQGRYGALTRSGRKTLIRLAGENGWNTIGVMPAITQAWPEASFYGYDKVLAAGDLGYKGLPFNWVTMPDQYTLSAFQRMVLAPASRAPVFAEIALISSHAPWTPIPTLLPWSEIGDGSVFNAQASDGASPEEVWSDHDRVRDQFRKAIDYTLRTIGEFAVNRADYAPLIVILGDHQPAPFVSGSETNRDVPIHIIGDAETISRLDDWGWTKGMAPSSYSPVIRMDQFRDKFLETFTQGSRDANGEGHSA